MTEWHAVSGNFKVNLAVNDGWFDSASDLLPPEKITPLYSTAVKLVIKTSAT